MHERLSRPDRPTAVLALWRDWSEAVGDVAGSLKLRLGRDLEMVGWCTEQQYEPNYADHFADGCVPPTIVWNVSQMAEIAIARLEAQRRQPGLPPALMQVDVRLRQGSHDYLAGLTEADPPVGKSD